MTYSRGGIEGKLDMKSRFFEIQTDRISYLQGDVVLVTVSPKLTNLPPFESLTLLISCFGQISKSNFDAKFPPNAKQQTKNYFELKNDFPHRVYPLSYSFTLPCTAPFTGKECSFVMGSGLIFQSLKLFATHTYRIDLFVRQGGVMYLGDQKDIVVRQTFNEVITTPLVSFDLDNYQMKITTDKASYYPQEFGVVLFEVNSKTQRATSKAKITLFQIMEMYFEDGTTVIKKPLMTSEVLPFQPYYYGKDHLC
ncbi:zinc finger protein, putative, partial [Entamoeba invadens IP1]